MVRCSVLDRCRVATRTHETAVAGSGSIAKAKNKQLQHLRALQQRCSSITEARKQQLQRPGVLQERCRGQEVAAVGPSSARERCRSVAGALQERCWSLAGAMLERRQSVADARKQQLQRPGALQERERSPKPGPEFY